MLSNFFLILTIITMFNFQTSLAADIAPPISVGNTLDAIGYKETVYPGQYIRIHNFNKNFAKWYHEALIVDEDNTPLNNSPVKISQEYLIRELMQKTNSKIEFIDQYTGESVYPNAGQPYLITSSKNSGWKTYSVQFLNSQGDAIDHKGRAVNAPRLYKISQSSLNADLLKASVKKVQKLEKTVAKSTRVEGVYCPDDKTPINFPSLGDPGYYFPQYTPIPNGLDSYTYFLRNRRRFKRKMSLKACHAEKTKLEEEILAKRKPSFAKLDLGQRANEIHRLAKSVYAEMIQVAGVRNKKSTKVQGVHEDFANGHYLDPVISPAVATCITFQETKDRLNPYAINYSVCSRGGMGSSAHGLGQATEGSLKNLMDVPSENHLPFETKSAKNYKNLTPIQIHRKMSDDTRMQLEVILRNLSSNAKFGRIRNSSHSNAQILRKAVFEYDRDNAEKYLTNVINKCVPCFKAGKTGAQCYDLIK